MFVIQKTRPDKKKATVDSFSSFPSPLFSPTSFSFSSPTSSSYSSSFSSSMCSFEYSRRPSSYPRSIPISISALTSDPLSRGLQGPSWSTPAPLRIVCTYAGCDPCGPGPQRAAGCTSLSLSHTHTASTHSHAQHQPTCTELKQRHRYE